MKKNQGITLIALVITIIVLLILAGVTFAYIAGDNGIITQTISAAQKYKIGQLHEQIELEILNLKTKKEQDGENMTIEDVLQNLLETKILDSIDTTHHLGYKDEYEIIFKYDQHKNVIIESINIKNNLEKVTITYNNFGSITEEKVTKGTPITLKTLTHSGFFFQGWSLEKNGTTIENSIYTPTSDITFYSIWKADESKSVTTDTLKDNSAVGYSSYHVGMPYYSFDKNISTFWRPYPGEKIDKSYLEYKFNNKKYCYKIDITFGYTVNDNNHEFLYKFQGSNDEKEWFDISDEITHIKAGTYTIRTNTLEPYQFFRFKGVSRKFHAYFKYLFCYNC